MTTTTSHSTPETTVEADPALPTIVITREFAAPRHRVYRAWADPDLLARWLGPDELSMTIETWDLRRGGEWRYVNGGPDGETYSFFGSFHDVRPDERIVQTFTFEGFPDAVFLETLTFADAGQGRTLVRTVSVTDSLEVRDGMISSGMETGVTEGYAKLDALLA